jgi:hypothetical protein
MAGMSGITMASTASSAASTASSTAMSSMDMDMGMGDCKVSVSSLQNLALNRKSGIDFNVPSQVGYQKYIIMRAVFNVHHEKTHIYPNIC